MNEQWSLTGTYFEACNCETACPCVFSSDPTDEECTVLVGWHIDSGSYGDVDLDDHPLCIAPGNTAVVTKSKHLSYRDHGQSWELSGKNGFCSPFTYQAG